MKERAYADAEAWRRLARNEEGYKTALARLDLWFGEREKASSMIEELVQKVGKPIWESAIADCYAILGNRDEFFSWVDRAISAKRIDLAYLRYSPIYDKVRDLQGGQRTLRETHQTCRGSCFVARRKRGSISFGG